jgi:hypothetical protein
MGKFTFQKATKEQARGRWFLAGPSGSGKSYTGLMIAKELAAGGKIAVIDTENGSSAKYSDEFEFYIINLKSPTIQDYIEALQAAEDEGFAVVVIDSLTHAWDAAKDAVDKEAARSKSANTFSAWRKVTPLWKSLLQAIVVCKCHVIATARSKQAYILEEQEDHGRRRQVPKKVGLEAEVRDGVEYEFDVASEMDMDHNLIITKSRCRSIDGQVVNKPTGSFFSKFRTWLADGIPAQEKIAPAKEEKKTDGPAKPTTPEANATTTADQPQGPAVNGNGQSKTSGNGNGHKSQMSDDIKKKVWLAGMKHFGVKGDQLKENIDLLACELLEKHLEDCDDADAKKLIDAMDAATAAATNRGAPK